MSRLVYEWDVWTFEPAEWRLLTATGEQVSLPNRTLELLSVLLDRAPSLVAKEEILTQVWRDSVVEEGNIAFHVGMLRKALDGEGSSCIETIRARGYRFVTPVTRRIIDAPHIEEREAEPLVDASPSAIAGPLAPTVPRRRRLPGGPVAATLVLSGLILGVGWFSWSRAAPPVRLVTNPVAHDLALQAREQWRHRTPHSIQQAIALYERAIAVDPGFARAYAGLADCYNLTMSGLPSDARYARARENAERAVALDPSDAAGHTSLAFLHYKFEWRWKDAESEFQRALALDPKYALAHHWYGEYLSLMGRYDDAIAHLRTAIELEPQSLAIQSDLITPLLRSGRVAEARAVLESAAATNPNWHFIPYRMAEVLRAEGRERESVESHWRWMMLSGASLSSVDELRAAYAAGGMVAMTRAEIARYLAIESAAPGAWLNATLLARAYARLGDRQDALRWNSIALDRREDAAISMLTAPDYDSLRDEPEFNRQLARVGLTPLQRR